MADEIILSLNCGSSSVKYMVYNWTDRMVMANGAVERVTVGNSFITHQVPDRQPYKLERDCPTHKEAIELILQTLIDPKVGVVEKMEQISAVGHRVVHGGEKFNKSVKIDDEVIATFEELSPLAPLHNPPNIQGIKAARQVLPQVPHVAIMDTAFHQTMPEHCYIYAVPYEWYKKYGVRRYGFHGTSHLYVSKRASVLLKKDPFEINLITCHIGNGVSFTAVKNGLSYDHSMGLTPLEGLVMGTRSGDIDPAIIPYMTERLGVFAADIEKILNKASGLFGITGKYTDRRDILRAAEEGDRRALLAIEIECHRIKKYIGSYSAILGRVDAVVFTAGVGEMAWQIREKACTNLENIGIKLDLKKNRAACTRNKESIISSDDSPVKVLVIPTDEELVFIEDVVAILKGNYDFHTRFKYSFQDPSYVNKMREEAYKKEMRSDR